jgi:hypothetical protein
VSAPRIANAPLGYGALEEYTVDSALAVPLGRRARCSACGLGVKRSCATRE